MHSNYSDAVLPYSVFLIVLKLVCVILKCLPVKRVSTHPRPYSTKLLKYVMKCFSTLGFLMFKTQVCFQRQVKYNAMAVDEACIYSSKMSMILFNSYLSLKAFGTIGTLMK